MAIDDFIDQVQDIVPEKLRQEYRLFNDQMIIEKMHHPKNSHEAELAKRSAIFREFFIFELQLALLTRNDGKQMGYAKKYDLTEIAQLTKSLPFELSDDQKHVVNEIFADMHSDGQMRRLLQGDVGSGKTVVAVYAIFAAITAGYQAALMVPTKFWQLSISKKSMNCCVL